MVVGPCAASVDVALLAPPPSQRVMAALCGHGEMVLQLLVSGPAAARNALATTSLAAARRHGATLVLPSLGVFVLAGGFAFILCVPLPA